MKNSFEKMLIWQKSIDLALLIYKVTSQFPIEEKYSLTSQLRRSVSSISANIAEGKGRKSNKELIRFLYIARGSLEECKSHVILSFRLNYINEDDLQAISKDAEELGIILNSFIRSKLKKSAQS